MGFPAAVGFALAKKIKKEEGNVYVIMSDGELNCGTTWEAQLIQKHHKLTNLRVLVDYNGFQAMGRTSDILNIPMDESDLVDGHDFSAIEKALDGDAIFKTIKGKGVSFMENQNLYHYKNLTKDEYEMAKVELNG